MQNCFLFIAETFLDKMVNILNFLNSVIEDASDVLNDACGQLSQNITEFALLRDGVSKLVSEVKKSGLNVIVSVTKSNYDLFRNHLAAFGLITYF